jgi:hypothetical protein
MRSKINDTEFHLESLAAREKPGVPGSPASSTQDQDAPESRTPDKGGQDVMFTIVDDPENESVFKGPGSYAATRAESAVHAVEEAFPPLRFELRSERNLTALHVQARVPSLVENEAFLVILSKALASTGTRLAPIVGELRKNALVAPDHRA